MKLFYHKNYYYYINNLFFFSNLKKTKRTKKWLLYIYWTYILYQISFYVKLLFFFKKKLYKYYSLYKYKRILTLLKYKKKKNKFKLTYFYKKFIYLSIFLLKYSIHNYYKYKIILNKINISLFFDFINMYLPSKYKSENFNFLLKKLKFWKINFFKKKKNTFIGFKYYKIFLKKKRNKKSKKLTFLNSDFNIKDKLNLFSMISYNLNWNSIIAFYKKYNQVYALNTFKDLFNLLDNKIDFLFMNYFGITSFEFNELLNRKALEINGLILNNHNMIVKNGFIIALNNINYNNKLIFFEKKIFFLFNSYNNNIKLNINTSLINKLKKIFINSIYLNKKNIYSLNYVKNYINLNFTYKIINLFNIKLLITIFFNTIIKKFNFKFIKFNIYLTINFLIYKLLYIINFKYTEYISSLNFFLYLIILLVLIKIVFYKNKINLKDILIYYFFKKKLKLYFFIKINSLIPNLYKIKNIFLFFPINNIFKFNLNNNFKNLTIINNIYYKTKLNFFWKNSIYYINNLIISKRTIFTNYFIIKNIKKIVLSFLKNLIFYNYVYYNISIFYKNLLFIYNLKKVSTIYNNNSKWLQIYNLKNILNTSIKKYTIL